MGVSTSRAILTLHQPQSTRSGGWLGNQLPRQSGCSSDALHSPSVVHSVNCICFSLYNFVSQQEGGMSRGSTRNAEKLNDLHARLCERSIENKQAGREIILQHPLAVDGDVTDIPVGFPDSVLSELVIEPFPEPDREIDGHHTMAVEMHRKAHDIIKEQSNQVIQAKQKHRSVEVPLQIPEDNAASLRRDFVSNKKGIIEALQKPPHPSAEITIPDRLSLSAVEMRGVMHVREMTVVESEKKGIAADRFIGRTQLVTTIADQKDLIQRLEYEIKALSETIELYKLQCNQFYNRNIDTTSLLEAEKKSNSSLATCIAELQQVLSEKDEEIKLLDSSAQSAYQTVTEHERLLRISTQTRLELEHNNSQLIERQHSLTSSVDELNTIISNRNASLLSVKESLKEQEEFYTTRVKDHQLKIDDLTESLAVQHDEREAASQMLSKKNTECEQLLVTVDNLTKKVVEATTTKPSELKRKQEDFISVISNLRSKKAESEAKDQAEHAKLLKEKRALKTESLFLREKMLNMEKDFEAKEVIRRQESSALRRKIIDLTQKVEWQGADFFASAEQQRKLKAMLLRRYGEVIRLKISLLRKDREMAKFKAIHDQVESLNEDRNWLMHRFSYTLDEINVVKKRNNYLKKRIEILLSVISTQEGSIMCFHDNIHVTHPVMECNESTESISESNNINEIESESDPIQSKLDLDYQSCTPSAECNREQQPEYLNEKTNIATPLSDNIRPIKSILAGRSDAKEQTKQHVTLSLRKFIDETPRKVSKSRAVLSISHSHKSSLVEPLFPLNSSYIDNGEQIDNGPLKLVTKISSHHTLDGNPYGYFEKKFAAESRGMGAKPTPGDTFYSGCGVARKSATSSVRPSSAQRFHRVRAAAPQQQQASSSSKIEYISGAKLDPSFTWPAVSDPMPSQALKYYHRSATKAAAPRKAAVAIDEAPLSRFVSSDKSLFLSTADRLREFSNIE